jgi:hypothetical protein
LKEESTTRGLRPRGGESATSAPVDVMRFGVTQKAVDEGAVRRLLVSNSIEVQDSGEIAKNLRDEVANRRGRREKKGEAKPANEIVVVIEAESSDLEAFLSEVAMQPDRFPPRMTSGFGIGGGMGLGMEGGMGGEMGGAMRPGGASRASEASRAGGMAVGRTPVPTDAEAREMGSDSRLGVATDKKDDRGDADKLGSFRRAAPADASGLPRGQAVILTEPDVPEPIDFAQSNLQSDTLFRRNAPTKSENRVNTKESVGLGTKVAAAEGEPRVLRQTIVVFEIVPPPPAATVPAGPAKDAAPATPGKAP